MRDRAFGDSAMVVTAAGGLRGGLWLLLAGLVAAVAGPAAYIGSLLVHGPSPLRGGATGPAPRQR